MNDAGRHIREQFTDTGGFTDHVFAACAILGYRFAPRIRDLPSKRLYAFNPSAAPAHLRALIGGKVNQSHDRAQLARHPAHRRHHCCRDRRAKPDSAETRLLSAAERARDSPAGSRSRRAHPVHDRLDSGCRTPTACPDRAQQGEAHHALKRAINFHRRGEIRDRSAEGQHYRIAGANLLAAIIIFWNTMKLGEVVANQKRDGKLLSPDLLAHVRRSDGEHINLTENIAGQSLSVDSAPPANDPLQRLNAGGMSLLLTFKFCSD